MIRKICVVTGGRADYGLLRLVMKEIQKCRKFRLQIIATGSHFLSKFGSTYREILKDGFKIDARVDMRPVGDSTVALGEAMGLGMKGLSRALAKLRPDLVLILGDRYEILAAAAAATLAGVPIAHLHGGELTEGAYDDALRHAVTKMSHFHFVATPEYRRRVIQMGETPSRVFQVGALGVDNVLLTRFIDRQELQKIMNFRFQQKNLLVTFHPTTLEPGEAGRQTDALLYALRGFPDAGIIFTMPGADKESGVIWQKIQKFARRNPSAKSFRSLGARVYLSVMKEVDVVAGNSSSGLLEAPVLKKPVVNIGTRQKGRILSKNILQCQLREIDIRKKIRLALSNSFAQKCKSFTHPFGSPGAASRIVKILLRLCTKKRLSKQFFNLRVSA